MITFFTNPLLLDNLIILATVLASLLGLVLLLHLIERTCGRIIARRLGWNAVLVTGWLGVPIHELSHLGVALLFRHRIVDYRLFAPDPTSGTLGYVRHARRRGSVLQILGTFFIAMAPLVAGGLMLMLILLWVVPHRQLSGLSDELSALSATTDLWAMLTALPRLAWRLGDEVWQHRTYWLPLQVYLAACVACHLAPSRADMAGGLPGFLVLCGVLLLLTVIAAAAGISLAGVQILVATLGLLTLCCAVLLGGYALVVTLVVH